MKALNNILYKAMALVGAISVLAACSDDFLQKDSLDSVSTATFWQTPADAENGLAACYDGLQSPYLYNGGPWECGPLNMDCMTDNGGHFNWSGWMCGYDITNGFHNSTSWMIGSYWSANYEVIKRCNSLIDNIERVEMDAAQIAQYKAEAIVLRSLMYANLTMTYNDVPYLTHTVSMTEANTPKTSREEIVADVVKTLKDCVNDLPVTAPALGRITKGAGLAVLGRIALYNKLWDEAIAAYEQVLTLGYSLHGNYKELFTLAGQTSPEIVLTVRFEGPGLNEGSAFAAHWWTPLEAMNGTVDLADEFYKLDGTKYTAQDACAYTVNPDGTRTPDLMSATADRYANRDPRLFTTLFVPGMTWGWTDVLYGGAAPSLSTLYVFKYFCGVDQDGTNCWDWGQDFYVIRYAEVLLSLAEAYVEKGSDLDKAADLVSQVRARVGMPSVAAVEGTGLSQAQMREIVRHERRVETAFEGLRLFDLYRWGLLKDAADRINAEAATYGFMYEYRNYRGELEYEWPLPQSDVDSNEGLEQNPLWASSAE